jgi:8-oxo-dGTP diphosphatase
MNSNQEIINVFGNRLRVRVCGILIEEDKILLIQHQNIGEKQIFWSPPGGGMDFGETAENCLKREFLEETGLEIQITHFLFVNEFCKPPLHSVELFFNVIRASGYVRKGTDPELSIENQSIIDVRWLSLNEINAEGIDNFHACLKQLNALSELRWKNGYFK